MTTYLSQQEAQVAADMQSRLMLASGTIIEFDGQNCVDSDMDGGRWCDGWDGNDHRCECGNRRVGWAFGKADNGTWHYYAEAQ